MRILIIGGTRFIGPYLVKGLVDSGHDVTVFHRGETDVNVPGSVRPAVRHLLGDRERLTDFTDEFARLGPDVVVDMYLLKQRDAIALMRTFRRVAGRVIAISSMDVYLAYGKLIGIEPGRPDGSLLAEDSPLRSHLYPYRSQAKDEDDLLYTYDKIPIERAILSDPDLPCTILRLPIVYGPLDYQHRLFDYLKRMDDGRPAVLLSKAKYAIRWTRGYVENVAHAIALAATDSRAVNRIYNVGEETALTEAEWVGAIGNEAGWPGQAVSVPEDTLPSSLKEPYDFRNHLAADTERIRTELGYMETVSHEEGLRCTVEWERANPPSEFDPKRFDYSTEDTVLRLLSG